MHNENAVQPHEGMSMSLKKEGRSDTRYHTDGP